MSDKRNDFIADNDLALYGEKIIVSLLNQSNVECYLSTYKSASDFSKVYEMMPDFWEQPSRHIKDYADGKQESKARYLIVEKVSLQGVGYIELDYSNLEMPEVAIAILGEYQGKGYAFEASKILFVNVFENESVECIVWNAFRSNKASCRIAEKLGGKVVEEKNLVMEVMQAAGLKVNPADYEKAPATVTYEIRKNDIY
ncbi:MAG: GNAT family N-acetyltransferase [Lachnospiraceae bacterium]|nr:GNAT family N-acetyltransferase [Lachnospiraceae bacterium]